MLVSCSEAVIPLFSVSSCSSSSRKPCAVRGRDVALLCDLAWLARVTGLEMDGFSGAPVRSGPKLFAKLLLIEEPKVEETGRGCLSYDGALANRTSHIRPFDSRGSHLGDAGQGLALDRGSWYSRPGGRDLGRIVERTFGEGSSLGLGLHRWQTLASSRHSEAHALARTGLWELALQPPDRRRRGDRGLGSSILLRLAPFGQSSAMHIRRRPRQATDFRGPRGL